MPVTVAMCIGADRALRLHNCDLIKICSYVPPPSFRLVVLVQDKAWGSLCAKDLRLFSEVSFGSQGEKANEVRFLIIVIIPTVITTTIIIIIIIAFKGAIRDFFTVSSLRRQPSPIPTLKWPGRNRVHSTCNTSSAHNVHSCDLE